MAISVPIFTIMWDVADAAKGYFLFFIIITMLLATAIKQLADLDALDRDHMNVKDFVKTASRVAQFEYVLLACNAALCTTYFGYWFMVQPQLLWFAVKAIRYALGGHKYDEVKLLKRENVSKHKGWATSGLFFYLICWFLYFARLMMSVVDTVVHDMDTHTGAIRAVVAA